jgi:hypothetical protein
MQSTPKILINIKDPAVSPKINTGAIDNVDNAISLVRLKDEKNKTFISLKPFLMAVKYLDLEERWMPMVSNVCMEWIQIYSTIRRIV